MLRDKRKKAGKCTHHSSWARQESPTSGLIPVRPIVDSGGHESAARGEDIRVAMVVPEVAVMLLPVLERMVLMAARVRSDGRWSSIVVRRVVRLGWAISRAAIVVPGLLADVELVVGAVAETHSAGVGRNEVEKELVEHDGGGAAERTREQATDQMTDDA